MRRGGGGAARVEMMCQGTLLQRNTRQERGLELKEEEKESSEVRGSVCSHLKSLVLLICSSPGLNYKGQGIAMTASSVSANLFFYSLF